MKRFFVLFMVMMVSAFILIGCGSQEAEPVMSEPVEETVEEAVEETPEIEEEAEIATNTLTTDDTTEREVENEGGVDVPTLEGEYSEYDNEEYADTSSDEYTYEEIVAGLKENYEKGYLTKEEYEECLEDAKVFLPGYVSPSSSTPPPTQIPPTYEFANAPLEQDTGKQAPPLVDDGSGAGLHVY